jgi:lysozyme
VNISPGGLNLIKKFEGLELHAYLDGGGVPTIGYGTTRYPNGEKVKMGDACTLEEAEQFLAHDVQHFVLATDALTTDRVVQRQFDALCSLVYNIGAQGYKGSTVRRLINVNPDDPHIPAAWERWCYDNGHMVPGLLKRRKAEVAYYLG